MKIGNYRHTMALAAAPALALGVLGISAATPAAAQEQEITVVNEWRTLQGWQSEWVPAYQCPSDYPYLLNRSFATQGDALLNGVEIERSQNNSMIDVSITGFKQVTDPETGIVYQGGIGDGALASSATNWAPLHPRSYRVKLHCTRDAARATWA